MRCFYSDEGDNKQNGLRGVAILETAKPVSSKIIQETLVTLPEDSRARLRGHFHASKDTTRDRQALGDAIRSNVRGRLHIALLDDIAVAEITKHFEGTRASEIPYQASLWVAYLVALLEPTPARFILEHRKGFAVERAREWLSKATDLWKPLLETATYAGPNHAPDINIEVVAKKPEPNPGLQIVDFLLWAYNRTTTENNGLFSQVVPMPAVQFPDMNGAHLKLFELK